MCKVVHYFVYILGDSIVYQVQTGAMTWEFDIPAGATRETPLFGATQYESGMLKNPNAPLPGMSGAVSYEQVKAAFMARSQGLNVPSELNQLWDILQKHFEPVAPAGGFQREYESQVQERIGRGEGQPITVSTSQLQRRAEAGEQYAVRALAQRGIYGTSTAQGTVWSGAGTGVSGYVMQTPSGSVSISPEAYARQQQPYAEQERKMLAPTKQEIFRGEAPAFAFKGKEGVFGTYMERQQPPKSQLPPMTVFREPETGQFMQWRPEEKYGGFVYRKEEALYPKPKEQYFTGGEYYPMKVQKTTPKDYWGDIRQSAMAMEKGIDWLGDIYGAAWGQEIIRGYEAHQALPFADLFGMPKGKPLTARQKEAFIEGGKMAGAPVIKYGSYFIPGGVGTARFVQSALTSETPAEAALWLGTGYITGKAASTLLAPKLAGTKIKGVYASEALKTEALILQEPKLATSAERLMGKGLITITEKGGKEIYKPFTIAEACLAQTWATPKWYKIKEPVEQTLSLALQKIRSIKLPEMPPSVKNLLQRVKRPTTTKAVGIAETITGRKAKIERFGSMVLTKPRDIIAGEIRLPKGATITAFTRRGGLAGVRGVSKKLTGFEADFAQTAFTLQKADKFMGRARTFVSGGKIAGKKYPVEFDIFARQDYAGLLGERPAAMKVFRAGRKTTTRGGLIDLQNYARMQAALESRAAMEADVRMLQGGINTMQQQIARTTQRIYGRPLQAALESRAAMEADVRMLQGGINTMQQQIARTTQRIYGRPLQATGIALTGAMKSITKPRTEMKAASMALMKAQPVSIQKALTKTEQRFFEGMKVAPSMRVVTKASERQMAKAFQGMVAPPFDIALPSDRTMQMAWLKTKPSQAQKTMQKQQQAFYSKIQPPQMPPPPHIPTFRIPPITLPKGYPPKAMPFRRRVQGYDVYGKERGRWVKINRKAMTRQEAYLRGAEAIDNTAAASFRLVKADEKVAPRFSYAELQPKAIPYMEKFYSRGGAFIEKARKRIDSPGEVFGISLKGWLGKKRKRKRR